MEITIFLHCKGIKASDELYDFVSNLFLDHITIDLNEITEVYKKEKFDTLF